MLPHSPSTPSDRCLETRLLLTLMGNLNLPSARQVGQRGFVLPIALLIVLVLALLSATITTRSLFRGQESEAIRSGRSVQGNIDDALSRARIKLDHLMNIETQADGRLPQGPASSDLLMSLLLDGVDVNGISATFNDTIHQTFKLPDETLINTELSAVGLDDDAPAWLIDEGDALTAYMIFTHAPWDDLEVDNLEEITATTPAADKVENRWVRNLPLRYTSGNAACAGVALPTRQSSWFQLPALLVKPFQVYAVTVPKDGQGTADQAIDAAQLQQDRYRTSLSEYGAYFRADLEVFPGPNFNWNGKMYSESNIMIGDSPDRFTAYLISDDESCFYSPSSRSEVSSAFEVFTGTLKLDNFNGRSAFHIWDGNDTPPEVTFDNTVDSVNGGTPGELMIDPGILFTQGVNVPRYAIDADGTYDLDLVPQFRDPAWESQDLATGGADGEPRITLLGEDDQPPPPYVDDSFRADDRCGPQPNYGTGEESPDYSAAGCTNIGDPITSLEDDLLRELPPSEDEKEKVGLDGYWERRAHSEGTRIVVGQRLNLLPGHVRNPGVPAVIDAIATEDPTQVQNQMLDQDEVQSDAMGRQGDTEVVQAASAHWLNTDAQPHTGGTPPTNNNGVVDFIEQAVQATALYHHTQGDFPVACLSTLADTTPDTPRANATTNSAFGSPIPNGNGLEFEPPPAPAFDALDTPLMEALRNLAHLSSDGDDRSDTTSDYQTNFNNRLVGDGNQDDVAGAFPPYQELDYRDPEDRPFNTTGATDWPDAHPHPALIRYGDFSNMRRALELMDGDVAYADLSLADKSYLHTAACALTMLSTVTNDENYRPALTHDFTGPNDRGLDGVDDQLGTIDDPFFLTEHETRLQLSYGALGPDNVIATADDPLLPSRALGMSAFAFYFGDTQVPPGTTLNVAVPAEADLIELQMEEAFSNYNAQDFSGGDSQVSLDPANTDNDDNPADSPFGPDGIPFTADDWYDWTGGDGILGNGNDPRAVDPPLNPPGVSAGLGGVNLSAAGLSAWDFFFGASSTLSEDAEIESAANNLRYFLDTDANTIPDTVSVIQFAGDPGVDDDVSLTVGDAVNQNNHPIFGPDRTPLTADDLIDWDGPNDTLGDADDPRALALLGPDGVLGPNPVDGTYGNNDDLPADDHPAVSVMINAFLLGPNYRLGSDAAASDYQPGTGDDLVGIDLRGADNLTGTVGADGSPLTGDDLDPWAVDDLINYGGGDGIVGTSDDPFPVVTIFAGVDLTDGAFNLAASNTVPDDAIRDVNIFNGRERNVVRVLDLDLNLLRTAAINGDFLFPKSGIMYTHREDAVREDAVARPADEFRITGNDGRNGRTLTAQPDLSRFDVSRRNGASDNGGNPEENETAYIYTNPYSGFDPPVTTEDSSVPAMGGLSTKPVDYYPDPLRRAHGFRLFNGASLGRTDDNNRGLSLITNNPVYVEGDFNEHTEFEFDDNRGVEDGNYTFGEFYGRSSVNASFANGDDDDWRPSEILADAITITNNFQDVANGGIPDDQPALSISGVEGRYGYRNSGSPGTTTVNMIMISGITPSRPQNSFGGIHNFPRFLQGWGRLIFSGSFVQLNFSTQATAPFDQDSWPTPANPHENSEGSEPIAYYGAPQRRWGYDVGLQYAPTSPVAARFNFPTNARDEFLTLLEANDPYVKALRCAIAAASTAYTDDDCP